MTKKRIHKLVWVAMLLGFAVVLMPMPVEAGPGMPGMAGYEGYHGWIDRLINEVLIAKGNDTAANWEPFVGQLLVVRTALNRGDEGAVYNGVNRFMDMLEMREGGIDGKAADFIFNYCFEVTPGKFHDTTRHTATYDPMWWWPLLGHGEIGGG